MSTTVSGFKIKAALLLIPAVGVGYGWAICAAARNVDEKTTLLAQNNSAVKGATLRANCATDLKKFILELDRLLTANPNTVRAFNDIKKQTPKDPCNINEAISIAKISKFFQTAYDFGPAYSILFENESYRFSFGLRKDTGLIYLPSAIVHCGGKSCL